MSERDKKLMNLIMENKEKYTILVDNDDITVYNQEQSVEIGTFDDFGYHLLNNIFNYLGINSELV